MGKQYEQLSARYINFIEHKKYSLWAQLQLQVR